MTTVFDRENHPHPEALVTCKSLTERHPGDAVAFYNLAAAYALLGRKHEALDALAKDAAPG